MLLGAYAFSVAILALCATGPYRSTWLPVAAIWLVLCAFKQSGVGTDLEFYTTVFQDISPDATLAAAREIAYGWEPGYVFLMLIAKRIGIDNPTVFLSGVALFNFIVVSRFIVRSSHNPAISFLFYVSTYLIWQQFVLVRQSLAISILLLALPYALSGRLWRSLLLVLFACMFHFSAIIAIPFFIAYRLSRSLPAYRLCLFSLGASAILAISAGMIPLGFVFEYLSRVRDYSGYIDGGTKNFLPFIEACGLLICLAAVIRRQSEAAYVPTQANDGSLSIDFQARVLALFLPIFAIAAHFEVINRFLEYERIIYSLAVGALFESLSSVRARNIAWGIIISYCVLRFVRFYFTFDQGTLQNYMIGLQP